MDFSRFIKVPVIDCHVHPWPPWRSENKLDEKELWKKAVELDTVMTRCGLNQMYVYGNPDHSALYLKAVKPGRFYAGGYAPWSFEKNRLKDIDWSRYVESLIELGYDGIGEMGAKPVLSVEHTPLDSPVYEDFWESCQVEMFPVVCHVGDPEEFWSAEQTPQWAKTRGWGYYRGGYPTLENLYSEAANVLERYPRLKIVFPHFLFLSPHIERLSNLLQRYPNAYIDLAPGVELVYNISRRRDEWRNFFIRHSDRVLFGTDIGMSKTIPEHLARIWLLRCLLESDNDDFYTPIEADELLTRYELPYVGLSLRGDTLENIYSGNFMRLWGNKPREVNLGAAASSSEELGNVDVAKALRSIF
jgi:predicted TIM-barrel fold metal-dependent hydrolase